MCITDVCTGRGCPHMPVCSGLSPKLGNSNSCLFVGQEKEGEEGLNPLQGRMKWGTAPKYGAALPAAWLLQRRRLGRVVMLRP